MRRGPLRAVLLLAACAVVVALGSWALRGAPPASLPVEGPGSAAIAAPGLDAPGTEGLLPPAERVAFWETRVADGGVYLDQIHLADAYLDRARAAGDVADLERADAALARAATTAPDPTPVRVREALVAFALHDFEGALATATTVLEADPRNLTAMTVVADSHLELGDVDRAAAGYADLADAAPSPAAWSRLGRLAYLRGDLAAATTLVGDAAAEALTAGFPDEVAFYHVQLGDLHRAAGDVAAAEAAYGVAIEALPEHPPAMAGLARVREAQGRRDDAIELLETATRRLPLPELVASLGDLYTLRGDTALADDQYALVEAIAGLSADQSVYDRVYVLFAADHERDVDAAVRAARDELTRRSDVHAHDALAWALFAAGRLDEAAAAAAEATKLGTADPRIAYHAGMIALAQGRDADARSLLETAIAGAMSLPPLQAPRAEAALASLDAP